MRQPSLGVRAAVAALFAAGLALAMGLPRPYWVELTAVVIVDESVGESARRARQRVAWTALGCPIGWLLAHSLASHHGLLVGLLFLFVFLAVYVRPVSVPLLVFFISVYVVFLFAVMGQWTVAIAGERVIDTALGSVAALAAMLPGWMPARRRRRLVDDGARGRAWALVAATLDGAPHAMALRRALVVEAAIGRGSELERTLLDATLGFSAAAEWAGVEAARASWQARLHAAFSDGDDAPATAASAATARTSFGRAAALDRYATRLESIARSLRAASTGRTSP